MQGKILTENLISGNDGNRYTFEVSDIENLNGETIQAIIGREVDFQIQENSAKSIFLSKQTFNLGNVGDLIGDTSVEGIKIKGYCSLMVYLWGIPALGQILAIVGFIAGLLVTRSIQKASGSTTLFRNFIIPMILYLVAGVLVAMSMGFGSIFSLMMSGSPSASFETFASSFGIGVVVAIIIGLAAIYFKYQYAKELATTTNQPFFLYAFFANIIGALTSIILIGFLFLIAALILEFMAWNRLSEIRKVNQN